MKNYTEISLENELVFYNPKCWSLENLIVELKSNLHVTKRHLVDELLSRFVVNVVSFNDTK